MLSLFVIIPMVHDLTNLCVFLHHRGLRSLTRPPPNVFPKPSNFAFFAASKASIFFLVVDTFSHPDVFTQWKAAAWWWDKACGRGMEAGRPSEGVARASRAHPVTPAVGVSVVVCGVCPPARGRSRRGPGPRGGGQRSAPSGPTVIPPVGPDPILPARRATRRRNVVGMNAAQSVASIFFSQWQQLVTICSCTARLSAIKGSISRRTPIRPAPN